MLSNVPPVPPGVPKQHREEVGPLSNTQPNQAAPPRPLAYREFIDLEIPQRECLLNPWLRAKDCVMVHAFRGTGKTNFSLGLAIALASGGTFLKWQAPRPRRVLLVDGEMAAKDLQLRLVGLTKGARLDPGANLRILSADLFQTGLPNLRERAGQEFVNDLLGDTEVLILDNVSSLFRGLDENEARAWEPIQTWFLELRRQGVTVVFIAHDGKSGDHRGTSKKEDTLDTVIHLIKSSGTTASQCRFVVDFTKSRAFLGEEARPFEVELQTQPDGAAIWVTGAARNGLQEEIERLHREGLSTRKIADRVGRSAIAVHKRLKKADNEAPTLGPVDQVLTSGPPYRGEQVNGGPKSMDNKRLGPLTRG